MPLFIAIILLYPIDEDLHAIIQSSFGPALLLKIMEIYCKIAVVFSP